MSSTSSYLHEGTWGDLHSWFSWLSTAGGLLSLSLLFSRDDNDWTECTSGSPGVTFEYKRPQDSISPSDGLVGEHWSAVARWKYPWWRAQTAPVMIKIVKAVKVTEGKPHSDSLKLMQKRLECEVDVLEQHKHRNIAPVIGYRIGQALFDKVVVTPWYDNGNVASWMRAKTPGLDEKERFIQSLCSGLEFLESHNMFHGDLKPENIFVDNESQAILTDFGLYAIFTTEGTVIDPNDFRPTNSSGNNVRWSSQERLRLEPYTSADDAYSFGCMVLYVLTELQPYHTAKTVMEFWKMKLHGAPPSSPQVLPNSEQLPESSHWWSVMRSCWLPATPEQPAGLTAGSETKLRPPMKNISAEVDKAITTKRVT